MTHELYLVVGLAASTLGFKASGLVLGRQRKLPLHWRAAQPLLAPALLAAMVVNGSLAQAGGLAIDGRLLGLGAAVLGLYLRLPLLAVMLLAALATAWWRL